MNFHDPGTESTCELCGEAIQLRDGLWVDDPIGGTPADFPLAMSAVEFASLCVNGDIHHHPWSPYE